MAGHAKKCVEKCCELANKKIEQLHKVSTPCSDDHQFKEEELETVGELLKVCSQIVLKSFCLARIGLLDISRYVSYLAGAVTKGNKAYDKRLARKYCHVGNFLFCI